MEPIRITPKEAREKAKAGRTLLVCGYEDEAKFKPIALEDSISFGEFKQKLPTISKDQDITFYCA